MLTLAGLFLALSAAGGPAAAVPPGEYHEVTTSDEISDFYKDNPEVKKISDKWKKDAERKKQEGQEEPAQRGLDDPPDPEVQERITQRLAAMNPADYMKDLVAEYLEEKGQLVEENIWSAGEEKATPEVRVLYRNYLRQLWNSGHGHDGDSTNHVNIIRRMLETPRGYRGFPTADMGPNPPGAAATYGGWHIRMSPGVLDICVFSHEMFHWTDDVQGGVDGEHSGPPPHAETHAYAQMCREL